MTRYEFVEHFVKVFVDNWTRNTDNKYIDSQYTNIRKLARTMAETIYDTQHPPL